MSLYEPQFREFITRTLMEFAPHYASLPAIELLLLTAAAESDFGTYLYQKSGPAKGLFQIEPDTHNSIHANYFHRRFPLFRQKEHDALIYDLQYQVIVARGIYADKTETLPSEKNIKGLAMYHKKHWNTYLGDADPENTVAKYLKYVKGNK